MDSGNPVSFFGKTDIVIGGIDLGIHALLSTLYWGGFLVGRAISSFFSKITARTQLIFTSVLATMFAITVITFQNIWFWLQSGFCILRCGVAYILGSWRWTWMLNITCELIILYYALFGSRIRKSDLEKV